MFAKLLIVVLTATVTAAALLSLRHQRLDLAHHASVIHRRVIAQQAALWEMQHRIAESCRPDRVRAALRAAGGRWVPIPMIPTPPLEPAAHLVDATDLGHDVARPGDA